MTGSPASSRAAGGARPRARARAEGEDPRPRLGRAPPPDRAAHRDGRVRRGLRPRRLSGGARVRGPGRALNRVKAVERGVDQLYNYIAELAASGLELAELRTRGDDLNARRDLQALQRSGVLGPQRAQRLERLRELRRLLVHEYATATAEQVHETASLVVGDFVAFYDAYRAWIARGFTAQPPT